MQKWEYKMVYRSREISGGEKGYFYAGEWKVKDIEATINSLGAEGWELVSAWPRSDYGGETSNFGGHIIAGMTTSEVWMFKRPIE
jgi:hypothetical protein